MPHYADPVLLREHLLQTLYYLHSQPPFLNLMIGVVLKLFPSSYGAVFNLIWMGMGLLFSIILRELMVAMGVERKFAFLLTAIFIISPAALLYENFFFYDYPLVVAVAVSAWLLHRYLTRTNIITLTLFFSVIALMILTRSLFHLAWMIVIIAGLMMACRDKRRYILLAALIPFLLALSVYVKNGIVFGSFSSSSWLGMSISRISTQQLDSTERERMVRDGEISPVSSIPAFSLSRSYLNYLGKSPATGIPVLDQVVKTDSAGNRLNFNNIAFIEISRQYCRDARHVMATHLGVVLKSTALATFYYFYPASTLYYMVDSNRCCMVGYERIFDILIYGQFYDYQHAAPQSSAPDQYGVPKIFKVSLVLLIGTPLLMFYGFRLFRRGLRGDSTSRSLAITLAFILGTMLWIMIVGIPLEVGENYRFRFMTEPFFFLLLGLFLTNRPWKKNAVANGDSADENIIEQPAMPISPGESLPE